MAYQNAEPTTSEATYNQPTAAPTAKVSAVGVAGVVIAALVSILTAFGVTLPDGLPEQANNTVTAIIVVITFVQAVITFLAGYFKKSNTKK